MIFYKIIVLFILTTEVFSYRKHKDRRYTWTTNVCNLPLSIGYGNLALPKWYYNNFEAKCDFFYYRGCCGNKNNFNTCEECQNVCEADPCQQRKNAGYGNKRVTRYFYDDSSKICLPFSYYGVGGNRNNFITMNECRETCSEIVPCLKGDPVYGETGKIFHCSSNYDQSCPKNYYCQLGSIYSSSYCCPKLKQALCDQPLSRGQGTETLPRWYFDVSSKQCLQFLFSGVQGNENNFLTQHDCEISCLLVCPEGKPYANFETVVICNGNFKQCPSHYFCHSGAELDSSVCCYSDSSNFCQLPADSGTGSDSLIRWYYNTNTGTCLKFVYSGMSGNANNFISKEFCEDYCQGLPLNTGTGNQSLLRFYFNADIQQCLSFVYKGSNGNSNNFLTLSECETTCYRTFTYQSTITSSIELPTTTSATTSSSITTSAPASSSTTPVTTTISTPLSTTPVTTTMQTTTTQAPQSPCAFGVQGSSCSNSDCPFPFFCNIGGNIDTTVCCPKPGNLENPCLQQLNVGVGNFELPRWYFDVASRQCLQFTYKGLQGNENNFLASQDCQNLCLICGQGSAFYANGQMVKCSASDASGCPATYFCHIGLDIQTTACCPTSNGNLCLLPSDQGSGSASLPRWFYDDTLNSCFEFIFKGLGGNENNFETKTDCENRCLKQTTTTSPTTSTTAVSDFVCDQDIDMGIGNNDILRYYFNKLTFQCLGFSYKGSGGNKNNFPRVDDCISSCLNPCAGNPPGKNASNNIIFCSNTIINGCPINYWCHIGGTPETSLCCPGSSNPCTFNQPAPGTGPYTLTRYFYNPATKQCEQFIYSGLNGNQNNFETVADCQTQCQTKHFLF